jgi:hypothetical protein
MSCTCDVSQRLRAFFFIESVSSEILPVKCPIDEEGRISTTWTVKVEVLH